MTSQTPEGEGLPSAEVEVDDDDPWGLSAPVHHEPVAAEPEPEPVAAEPEPEPEPVAVAEDPEPEPVAVAEPEPVAAEPEPEPEPVAVAEPEPVAVAEPSPPPVVIPPGPPLVPPPLPSSDVDPPPFQAPTEWSHLPPPPAPAPTPPPAPAPPDPPSDAVAGISADAWSHAWDDAGYQLAPPPPSPTAASGGSRRRPLVVALVVIVVAAVAGLAIGLSGGSKGPSALNRGRTTTPTTSAAAADSAAQREVARNVNLAALDVPTGWTVDTGSPLFSSGGSSTSSAATQKAESTLESCLDVPAAEDPLGSSDSGVDVSSPAYLEPPGPAAAAAITEIESDTQVMSSAAQVNRDVGVITMAKFPACFGQVMSDLITGSASSGVTTGTPHGSAITIEQVPGVHAVGIEITIPVTSSSTTENVDIQLVFIGGGRLETLLTGVAVGQRFPLLVTAKAAYDIEQRVASEGLSSGA